MDAFKPSKIPRRVLLISVAIVLLSGYNNEPACGQSKSVVFNIHVADSDIPGINCIRIVDLDLDGDPDIVGGSEITPSTASVGLKWWRNEGGNPIVWTKFSIDTTFLHVMSVDVADLNGDSFPDLVASSWAGGKLSWWKNSGDPTVDWEIFDIKTGWTNAHDAKCFDIDGDSLIDVVGVSAGDNTISVFYNQTGATPSWSESIVSSSFNHALSISIADLNGDGFPDITGSADGADQVAWWKNSGTHPPGWQKFIIDNHFTGAGSTSIADLNNDNQPDVIGAAWESNEISYWLSEDINANLWNRTILASDIEIPVKAIVCDIDSDGDSDIVAAGKIPGELSVFYNDSGVYSKEILYNDGGAAIAVVDIDQDGDRDIVSGAESSRELIILYNTGNSSYIKGEEWANENLCLYPNPSTGIVHLSCIQTIDRVSVRNHTGCEVFTILPHSNHAKLQFDRDGIYLLSISCDGKTFTRKMLVHKE